MANDFMSHLLNGHMAAFQQARLVYPKCSNSPYLPLPLSTMYAKCFGQAEDSIDKLSKYELLSILIFSVVLFVRCFSKGII